ncbi:similar to Saccharomyces cerevisiae YLR427W MAG2 Cytoplasmic protein of unknown function [Maudiozyma saulgeensis]|uniref:RING-type domain-containing protein n=1 Tax=Maudiozyma saulgeensis TaxID=1789683 RepID=A0A1X7R920_9SACH|nr:similar to Saccharomyces cerevisiae YLR427W MAG2 Cytoplasmic protein of unknown function [Kazachstania saulgeensis]
MSDKDVPSSSSSKNSNNDNNNAKGKQHKNRNKNTSNKNANRPNSSQGQYSSKRQGQYKRKQNNQYKQANNGGDNDLAGFSSNFNSSIEDEIINGNFKLRGRRTQVSIKHLLDFNLPEIERNNENDSIYKRTANKRKEQNREHIHLSGDSFINVNSRFLVKDSGDYNEQRNNPNIPLPDSQIVRVVVSKGQSCPICLCEEPVAPRMVTCGHIFCASCLINFFSVEETITNKETGFKKKKKYKDCPLCGNIVRPQMVKDVIFEDEFSKSNDTIPMIGSEIELKLMCKPHGSLLPLPVELNIDPCEVGDFPNYAIKNITSYSHIMKCDISSELALLQRDIDSISTQYEIDRALFNEDKKYVDLAINSTNDKIILILSEAKDEDGLALSVTDDIASLSLGESNEKTLTSKYSDKDTFFFYETAFDSSTKYFLSHLDVKILLSSFKVYSSFPESLRIEVENIHFGTVVTEQLIKRLKYISHLPLGTELAFIDIDWRKIDIIPKEIYDEFANELKSRRRQFNRRKQKEDHEKKMYQQKLEEDQMRFYQEENGTSQSLNDSSVELSEILNSSSRLDSLSASTVASMSKVNNANTNNTKKTNYEETTIWGTSISVHPDEKTSKENQEFEEMLLQKINNNSKDNLNLDDSLPITAEGKQTNGKRKKKKGKVLLFST